MTGSPLPLLLSGCAVLAVNPEVREVFAGWVREVYENVFVYHFYGEEQVDRELLQETETFYRPAWRPEGHVLYERSFLNSKVANTTIYENLKGEFIIFHCQLNGDDSCLYLIPNGESAEKRVSMTGHLGSRGGAGAVRSVCWEG